VHRPLGKDEVVANDVVGIGRQVRELDDLADSVEDAACANGGCDDDPVPRCPEATIVPVNVSLPLVAAAPDEATASAAHAARTAASAPLFR
jgi:hypothetical protein